QFTGIFGPSAARPECQAVATAGTRMGARATSAPDTCVPCGLPVNPSIPTPSGVAASVAGSMVTLSFSVTGTATVPAGNLDGFIVEAGSAPGLSDLGVIPVNFPGGFSPAGSTVVFVTPLTFTNVPAGVYYARIRSYNQFSFHPVTGRSNSSGEVQIV